MPSQTEDLEGLHVAELRDRAKAAGIAGGSHMRKDELVEALRGDTHASDEKSKPKTAAKPKGKAPTDTVDVIALLTSDHAEVRDLFHEALGKESGDSEMQDIATEIVAKLKLHTEVEETIFYPALKEKAIAGEEDDAKDEVLEAYVEHASVKELIARIEGMTVDDESYKAVLQVMSEQIEHHVEEEESEMFKQARELLSEDELLSIGREIKAMKEAALSAA